MLVERNGRGMYRWAVKDCKPVRLLAVFSRLDPQDYANGATVHGGIDIPCEVL